MKHPAKTASPQNSLPFTCIFDLLCHVVYLEIPYFVSYSSLTVVRIQQFIKSLPRLFQYVRPSNKKSLFRDRL